MSEAKKKAVAPKVKVRVAFDYDDSLKIAKFLDQMEKDVAGTNELSLRMWHFICQRFPECKSGTWVIRSQSDEIFIDREDEK